MSERKVKDWRSGLLGVLAVLALVAGACSDDDDTDGDASAPTEEPTTAQTDEPETEAADGESEDASDNTETEETPEPTAAPAVIIAPALTEAGCDPLLPDCLLPFPSNAYTVPDDETGTGRRVAFVAEAMPANTAGDPIDPAAWADNDGFSPGAAATVRFPGVDLQASGAAPITDIARSLDDDSPTVIVDADTGERWPHWAELDANVGDSGEDPVLFLRPARNFPDGHRIVVGIRNLVDGDGTPFEPTEVFAAYRDETPTDSDVVEQRRDDMESTFAVLADSGVERSELQLAWDFSIISTENLTGPLLFMRDEAFAELGDAAPGFEVTEVDDSGRGDGEESQWDVTVRGTFEVPLFLEGDGGPGSRLAGDDHLAPTAVGTYTAPFTCGIPRGATDEPAQPMIYGHGLLGEGQQALSTGPRLVSAEFNRISCGTDLIGMADEDTGHVLVLVGDLSAFDTLADRLLQGHLNTLFLGRLMIHPDGLASDPAFADVLVGGPDADLQYYGISQGGIMGAATTAVATDWNRAVLGVPGINYSMLLNRSVDFDPFFAAMSASYPSPYDQALALQLIQMLWDRGEGNGYANHLGAYPLPGTPPDKSVLLTVAFGDHQVANVATEVLARTVGASVGWPALADGRSPDVEVAWGIPRIEEYPFEGSALVIWDSGIDAPPIDNIPPREGDDPHDDPRAEPASVTQRGEFLTTGLLPDVCAGAPCTAEPR